MGSIGIGRGLVVGLHDPRWTASSDVIVVWKAGAVRVKPFCKSMSALEAISFGFHVLGIQNHPKREKVARPKPSLQARDCFDEFPQPPGEMASSKRLSFPSKPLKPLTPAHFFWGKAGGVVFNSKKPHFSLSCCSQMDHV